MKLIGKYWLVSFLPVLCLSVLLLPVLLMWLSCPVMAATARPCTQTYGIHTFYNAQQRVMLSTKNHQTYATFSLKNKQDKRLQFKFPVCVAPRLIVISGKSAYQNPSAFLTSFSEITAVEPLWTTSETQVWLIHFTQAVALQQRLANKMQHLSHEPGILSVQPDILIDASLSLGQETKQPDTITPALSALWQHTTGKGIKIAIIDDGFYLQHRDLTDVRVEYPTPDTTLPTEKKTDFHGTRVAGLIFAQHNHQDINGIAPDSTLIPITITGSYTSSLLRTLRQAFRHHPDIINISWYLPWIMRPIKDAIHDIAEHGRQGKGTVIIVASGNHAMPESAPYSLAGMTEVLTVGAYHVRRHKHTKAQGSYIDLAAPVGFMSLFAKAGSPKTTHVFNGSSAATPYMSGLSALFLSVCPRLHRDQLYQMMINNTDSLSEPLRPFMGAGLINTDKAWQALLKQCRPQIKPGQDQIQEYHKNEPDK